MTVLSSTELGDGLVNLVVDHDPRVTATDCRTGSAIISLAAGIVGYRFIKLDDGLTTNVTPDTNDVSHGKLRQLIHFIEEGPAEGFASGAYSETLPAADPFPTSTTWYTSAAKTHKIVDEVVTYNANKTIATDQWRAYDVDGATVVATVVDAISYTAVFETSRTRTIS